MIWRTVASLAVLTGLSHAMYMGAENPERSKRLGEAGFEDYGFAMARFGRSDPDFFYEDDRDERLKRSDTDYTVGLLRSPAPSHPSSPEYFDYDPGSGSGSGEDWDQESEVLTDRRTRADEFSEVVAVEGKELGYQKAALDTINYFREEHGAPDLSLDPELTKEAESWARRLASGNLFPSPSCTEASCKFGESIGIVSVDEGETPDLSAAVRRLLQSWYAQGRNYAYGGEEGNNFTQLIWKATQRLGVGVGLNPTNDRLYVVLHFVPPGNRKGLFQKNLAPAY